MAFNRMSQQTENEQQQPISPRESGIFLVAFVIMAIPKPEKAPKSPTAKPIAEKLSEK